MIKRQGRRQAKQTFSAFPAVQDFRATPVFARNHLDHFTAGFRSIRISSNGLSERFST